MTADPSRAAISALPRLLSYKDVCRWLCVSERTIYALVKAGKLPAIKVGTQVRFKEEAVQAWIDAGGAQ